MSRSNIIFIVNFDMVSFYLFQADSMVSLSDSSSYLAEKLEENEAKVKFIEEYFCKNNMEYLIIRRLSQTCYWIL